MTCALATRQAASASATSRRDRRAAFATAIAASRSSLAESQLGSDALRGRARRRSAPPLRRSTFRLSEGIGSFERSCEASDGVAMSSAFLRRFRAGMQRIVSDMRSIGGLRRDGSTGSGNPNDSAERRSHAVTSDGMHVEQRRRQRSSWSADDHVPNARSAPTPVDASTASTARPRAREASIRPLVSIAVGRAA